MAEEGIERWKPPALAEGEDPANWAVWALKAAIYRVYGDNIELSIVDPKTVVHFHGDIMMHLSEVVETDAALLVLIRDQPIYVPLELKDLSTGWKKALYTLNETMKLNGMPEAKQLGDDFFRS